MDGTDDYVLDEQVGFLMRRANQRHLAIFARSIPDLTPTQFAALARLCELERVSQNALGRATAMDAATIKGVVDRLRARGLVEVTPDEVDQRRVVLAPPARRAGHCSGRCRRGRRRSLRKRWRPCRTASGRRFFRFCAVWSERRAERNGAGAPCLRREYFQQDEGRVKRPGGVRSGCDRRAALMRPGYRRCGRSR
ncbi:MarR family winged helix-turn-helix transcriptional regulator [Jhaorihella thermophila]